jgi:hypothetical protein
VRAGWLCRNGGRSGREGQKTKKSTGMHPGV